MADEIRRDANGYDYAGYPAERLKHVQKVLRVDDVRVQNNGVWVKAEDVRRA